MKKGLFALLTVLSACNSSESNGPTFGNNSGARVVQDNLEFRAETLIMESFPVQLRTIVRVTNATNAPADLTFPDGCKVLMRVYRDESRRSLAYDMTQVFGCTMAIEEFRIAPGTVREFDAPTISAAAILGDSLPNGTYYISAVLRPNGKLFELDAGSAQLAK